MSAAPPKTRYAEEAQSYLDHSGASALLDGMLQAAIEAAPSNKDPIDVMLRHLEALPSQPSRGHGEAKA